MHDNDESDQEQWKLICGAVRVRIARKIAKIEKMDMDDLWKLMRTIDEAMSNDIKAASFDEAVESRRNLLIREGHFGG